MKILGYDPYVKQEAVDHLGVTMVSLDQLLKESDLVTLHVVLTRETRGMIGMREFKIMKPTRLSSILRADRQSKKQIWFRR